jgi:hypothetical protein
MIERGMTYPGISALLRRALPALAACLPPHVAFMLVSAPAAASLIRAALSRAARREPIPYHLRIDR